MPAAAAQDPRSRRGYPRLVPPSLQRGDRASEGGEAMILVGLALLNVVRRRDSKHSAITHHIKERGGHVVRIRPTPFAEAWFGKTDGPVFDVTYRDPRGVERQTTCKVSPKG